MLPGQSVTSAIQIVAEPDGARCGPGGPRKAANVCRLSLIACCFLSSAHAQFVIDSWSTENGLPQNSVLSIQQTPDGYLWLTTFDGLVRFDGMHFSVFNKINTAEITSNRFISLFCEPDGTLWAATEDSGVVRYRGGRFQSFTVRNGLPSNRVVQVQRDTDGSLRFDTDAG